LGRNLPALLKLLFPFRLCKIIVGCNKLLLLEMQAGDVNYMGLLSLKRSMGEVSLLTVSDTVGKSSISPFSERLLTVFWLTSSQGALSTPLRSSGNSCRVTGRCIPVDATGGGVAERL